MAKITIPPDCGNAPRKLFLKDFYIAIAKCDLNYLSDVIPEGIVWNIVGHVSINGKEDYLSGLKNHKVWKIKELDIDTIITHGRDASVSGHVLTKDNKKFSFSEIYRFKATTGMVINSVTTFVI